MLPEIMRDDVFRLETVRLWLRWPRARDAEAITAMAGNPEVARMTAKIPHPYPQGEAVRHIEHARASNEAGRAAVFVLTRKGWPDTALGLIGLHVQDRPADVLAGAQALSVGYFVGREHWGQGLATEALLAVTAAAFLFSPTAAIHAGAMASNPASRRVQEKCGFVYAGSAVEHFPARAAMIAVDNLILTRERWARLPRCGSVSAPAAGDVAQGALGSACL